MRIGVAALLAAIVLFLWQFLAHMVLPIGQMGFRLPQNEDIVLSAVSTGLPTPGIYYLPSIDPAKMSDPAVMKAWTEKSQKSPYVFAVVNTPPAEPGSMTFVMKRDDAAWKIASWTYSAAGPPAPEK